MIDDPPTAPHSLNEIKKNKPYHLAAHWSLVLLKNSTYLARLRPPHTPCRKRDDGKKYRRQTRTK